MAVSAFRSTSRRGNSSSMGEEEGKKRGSNRGRAEDKAALPTRRSRSVSAAIPRSRSSRGTTITDNASAPLISSSSSTANHLLHFDNPLFASHHPPTRTPSPTNTTNSTTLTPDDSRGRSMARASFSSSSSSAPSLSHTRSRGRSASRPSSRRYSHECESEPELIGDGGKSNSEVETRRLQTWSSRHPVMDTHVDAYASGTPGSIWDDAISTSTVSEVEEKNDIKSVLEHIKANDLDSERQPLNLDAKELVSDIRKEYASKLEQSQERARKLRTFLAIEEQRGQELNQILNDMLPDTELPETQKSRTRRKASIERRKMSKRLMEEAMMYFDECVSISTFDNSDFSAPEETPIDTAATAPMPEAGNTSNHLQNEGLNAISPGRSSFHLNPKKDSDNISQYSFKHDCYDVATGSSSDDNSLCISVLYENRKQSPGTSGVLNLRSYIQKFVKEDKREGPRCWKTSIYDAHEYSYRASAESVLYNVVDFKSRIECGGLHLCGAGLFCDF